MDRKLGDCGQGDGERMDDDSDCTELIRNLFLLLDGELAGHTCADLEEHLHRCHGCLERYGVERAFKNLIRRRCSQEPVPDVLIQRIRITLRSQIQ
jgi:mycothiol system anti-sigma-R factor